MGIPLWDTLQAPESLTALRGGFIAEGISIYHLLANTCQEVILYLEKNHRRAA